MEMIFFNFRPPTKFIKCFRFFFLSFVLKASNQRKRTTENQLTEEAIKNPSIGAMIQQHRLYLGQFALFA